MRCRATLVIDGFAVSKRTVIDGRPMLSPHLTATVSTSLLSVVAVVVLVLVSRRVGIVGRNI